MVEEGECDLKIYYYGGRHDNFTEAKAEASGINLGAEQRACKLQPIRIKECPCFPDTKAGNLS